MYVRNDFTAQKNSLCGRIHKKFIRSNFSFQLVFTMETTRLCGQSIEIQGNMFVFGGIDVKNHTLRFNISSTGK